MKIEHANTSHINVARQPLSGEVKAESSVKNSNKRPDAVKRRINGWFAQIGISPNAELSSYQDRTTAARRHEDIRKVQRAENLRSIMTLALDVTVAEVSEDNMDADWFHAYIALAENIYSPEMQELWSKILAVEISRPGSFSLRSLKTLRLLTQKDAQRFTAACRLATRRVGDPVPRIILHYHQRKTLSRLFFRDRSTPVNLANFGLSYPNLLSLIDLGLIMPSEIESAEFPMGQSVHFRCGETGFTLKARRSGVALSYYKFTSVGAELYLLTKKHEQPDYYQSLKQTLEPAFRLRD